MSQHAQSWLLDNDLSPWRLQTLHVAESSPRVSVQAAEPPLGPKARVLRS